MLHDSDVKVGLGLEFSYLSGFSPCLRVSVVQFIIFTTETRRHGEVNETDPATGEKVKLFNFWSCGWAALVVHNYFFKNEDTMKAVELKA